MKKNTFLVIAGSILILGVAVLIFLRFGNQEYFQKLLGKGGEKKVESELSQDIGKVFEVVESKETCRRNPPQGKNHLYFEKSPYLKQHENNPVNWYPWCKEAFEKAKRENKLIFISIGYSTCHWCHVMEKESFSNPEIAELMNEVFVSIKIDREERPDLDRIFMTLCELTIRNCGWPLNVVLTPDGLPFFVATYIPPETKGQMIGMKELIPRIKDVWENQRERVYESGRKIVSAVKKLSEMMTTPSDYLPYPEILSKAFDSIKSMFDVEYGGFGRGTKFPNPTILMLSLRIWKREKDPEALFIVEKTLRKMREGGIYDHIGGGFHRYAVERTWLVPHFEKMLYDQALLTYVYTEAFQATGRAIFKDTAEETISYVFEKLLDPKTGCFYSAQDAESEGEEGKFYLWEADEIKKILGEGKETEIFMRHFGISESGNTPFFGQKNILHIAVDEKRLAEIYGLSEEEIRDVIREGKKKLKMEREKRVPPATDTKILTDWNSLMISSLAKAGVVFDNKKYIDHAEKCARFILEKMYSEDKKELFHMYKDGEVDVEGMLEDYVFFSSALLELYEATLKPEYLIESKAFLDLAVEKFFDSSSGGFFTQQPGSDFVFTRMKEVFDGATPSGNSVALLLALKMYRITGDTKYKDIAEKTMKVFMKAVESSPVSHSFFMCGIDFFVGPSYEVVVVPPQAGKEEAENIAKQIAKRFIPRKVLMLKDKGIEKLSDFIKDMSSQDGRATIYVCLEGVCKAPTTKLEEALKDLDS